MAEVINWITETEKRTNLKGGDKLLLGNSDTNETMHTLVQDLNALASSGFVAVTGTVLPTLSTPNNYTTVTEGTYTRAGQSNVVVPAGKMGILVWNGLVWSIASTMDLPKAYNRVKTWEPGTYQGGDNPNQVLHKGIIWSVNVSSTTAEPGTNKDWKEDLHAITPADIATNSLLDLNYLVKDVLIGGAGNVLGPYPDTRAIVDQPLQANKVYTFGGVALTPQKLLFLVDHNGNHKPGMSSIVTTSNTFQTDSVYRFLRVSLRGVGELNDSGWINTAMLNVGMSLSDRSATHVNGFPVFDINAMPFEKGILKSDVVFKTDNLFDINNHVVFDAYINSVGNISNAIGWCMASVDVSQFPTGQAITFFGNNGAVGLYYAFFSKTSGLLSFSSFNNILPKTINKPAGADTLYVDIKRPDDPMGVYNEFRVNLGNASLPFSPFDPVLVSIDGKRVPSSGGGEAYNQSLNTFDDVEFNRVKSREVEIEGELKSGTLASPPDGLISGEYWLDTTDSSVNPILRKRV